MFVASGVVNLFCFYCGRIVTFVMSHIIANGKLKLALIFLAYLCIYIYTYIHYLNSHYIIVFLTKIKQHLSLNLILALM